MLRRAVALHPPDCRRLALVMGASTLGQRFIVLPIPVLIRGCAIPVAWRIVRATAEGAWQPQWEALVRQRHGSAPDDWAVIVAADRGLYATRLFQAITARGWHPFVRIRRQRTSLTPMAHVRQPANRIRTRPGKHPTPQRGNPLGSGAARLRGRWWQAASAAMAPPPVPTRRAAEQQRQRAWRRSAAA